MGRITSETARILEPIRVIGNEAAHEGGVPPRGELLLAWTVVESLLAMSFLVGKSAEELSEKQKARRDRRPKGPPLADGDEEPPSPA